MKKLVSLLLAVCMCLSVGVMLTACGHEHTYQTEWSKNTTHHWHACEGEDCAEVSDKAEHTWDDGAITTEATKDTQGVKTFTCTTCSQTKTERVEYVAKATVTAEEWVTALNFSEQNNFEYIQVVSPANNGWMPNTTVKVTQDTVYIETDFSNYINKEFYSNENNEYFRYRNENDAWNKTSIEQTKFENCYKEIVGLAPIFDYENFVFDNVSNSYKAEQTGSSDFVLTTNVTVVFEDGKVVSIQFTTGDIQVSITATYGTAEITLPAIE